MVIPSVKSFLFDDRRLHVVRVAALPEPLVEAVGARRAGGAHERQQHSVHSAQEWRAARAPGVAYERHRTTPQPHVQLAEVRRLRRHASGHRAPPAGGTARRPPEEPEPAVAPTPRRASRSPRSRKGAPSPRKATKNPACCPAGPAAARRHGRHHRRRRLHAPTSAGPRAPCHSRRAGGDEGDDGLTLRTLPRPRRCARPMMWTGASAGRLSEERSWASSVEPCAVEEGNNKNKTTKRRRGRLVPACARTE